MAGVRAVISQNALLSCVVILAMLSPNIAAQTASGCDTGGNAVANAYVRMNALYAYFFGSVESYVVENRAHFEPNGDAIRCANALSRAFLGSSMQLYDPNELRRRDELNARLGAMGVSPGPAQPSASQQLYGISMQLARLARVLPSAADGDYTALYTPANELEQTQIVASQMMMLMLQDPGMAAMMQSIQPLAEEAANIEYRMIVGAAAQLANTQ